MRLTVATRTKSAGPDGARALGLWGFGHRATTGTGASPPASARSVSVIEEVTGPRPKSCIVSEWRSLKFEITAYGYGKRDANPRRFPDL